MLGSFGHFIGETQKTISYRVAHDAADRPVERCGAEAI
jgi:hypothetical protein